MLLCPPHHNLVYVEGFSLVLLPDRRLSISTAAGIAVPHRPPLPFEPAQDLLEALQLRDPVDARTLPSLTTGDRLDLHYAVAVVVQHAA